MVFMTRYHANVASGVCRNTGLTGVSTISIVNHHGFVLDQFCHQHLCGAIRLSFWMCLRTSLVERYHLAGMPFQ